MYENLPHENNPWIGLENEPHRPVNRTIIGPMTSDLIAAIDRLTKALEHCEITKRYRGQRGPNKPKAPLTQEEMLSYMQGRDRIIDIPTMLNYLGARINKPNISTAHKTLVENGFHVVKGGFWDRAESGPDKVSVEEL